MRISAFNTYRRSIIAVTAIPLIMFLLQVQAVASPNFQEKPEVRNVVMDIKENVAVITYDLIASFNETYEITAALIKEGDASFRIPVKNATGDIGRGKYAGLKREIRWEWNKDLPRDFAGGPEYSIEVSASLVSEGGGSWIYYVLGGALIAGGVVAFAGKKSADDAKTSSPLPTTPPGRPF